jgi:hypothetical protein
MTAWRHVASYTFPLPTQLTGRLWHLLCLSVPRKAQKNTTFLSLIHQSLIMEFGGITSRADKVAGQLTKNIGKR